MAASWSRPVIGAVGTLLALSALLAGCTSQERQPPSTAPSPSGARPPSGLDAEGAAAWERWQSLGSDTYRYRLRVLCFCPGVDTTVTVVSGEVARIGRTEYVPGTVVGFGESDPTVEGLFEQVAEAQQSADDVEVVFDKVTGVPTALDIDWMDNAVDDEISYRASALETFVSQ